jgi:hypothetical protein
MTFKDFKILYHVHKIQNNEGDEAVDEDDEDILDEEKVYKR